MSPADITITDTEEPVAITLSVSPEYIQEGQLAAQVVVTATRDSTEGEHTVTLSLSDSSTAIGWPVDGADYVLWSLYDITIEPGETSGSTTLTFTVIDDGVDEGNETIVLAGAASWATVSDAVITIGDSEPITLSVSPDTIAENGGATEVTVTATLSQARAADTLVDLTLGGTATDPADYTASELASITIPKGQTSANGTLTITPVSDSLEETSETITVSGESGARPVSPADITITDTPDAAPVLSFSSAPTSVDEGQSATYTVKLEGSRSTNVTVRFKTGADNDLATAGQDYTAVDSTLTFLPADNTKTVTVETLADQRFEIPERFTVSLSNPQGGGGLAPVIKDGAGSKTTTINDNFKEQPGYPKSYTLLAVPTTVGEGDGATSIAFTATLPRKMVFPIPVDLVVYVADEGQKGTAALNEDYALSGSHGQYLVITIPAEGSSGVGTLTLEPVDDSRDEGDETVIFTSFGGAKMTTSDRPTITITDNDTAPDSITLSAIPSILREESKDATSEVTVTATLDGGATLATPTVVTVSLADGTAEEGSDYSAAGARVTIDPGESSGSATLSVPLLADTSVEDDESIRVTGTAQGFTVNPAELIILDDDGAANTGITLYASPSTVPEDAGDTVVTVTAAFRQGQTTADTLINLSLADGTATLDSGDYSASTGTVTIPAGQYYGTGPFTITPKADAIVELDETVLLNGSFKGQSARPATITIVDSTAALSISGPSASVTEGDDATFTVTLSKSLPAQVKVAWSAPLSTDSAKAADLDNAISGTVTFAPNAGAGATRTITVTTEDDNLSEKAETFTVTLGTVTSSLSSQVSVASSNGSAQATIAESDPIEAALVGPVIVDEGDDAKFTVSLSPADVKPTEDLIVSYTTADGTAKAGSDYEARPAR